MSKIEITKAVEALSEGKLVVYPTDTLYGLGADMFNDSAIKKVFIIKNRPKSNPLSVAVADFPSLQKIAYTNKITKKLVENLLPGKLTIILNKKNTVSSLVTGGLDKIAIRIPDNEIALELVKKFGPITATSANIHGQKTPGIINDINMQFKDKVEVYIDDGPIEGKPSTIVDASSNNLKIIRQGAINQDKILSCI